MSVRVEECSYCQGAGVAERWVKATVSSGLVIYPDQCSDELQKSISRGIFPNTEVEWEETDCPRCDGRGRYMVEQVTARIFA